MLNKNDAAHVADFNLDEGATVPSPQSRLESEGSGSGKGGQRVALPTILPHPGATSHHVYAAQTLQMLTREGNGPVFHRGELYVIDLTTSLWMPMSLRDLVRLVAEQHDGKKNCSKSIEYTGIAEHAQSLVSDSEFFDEAPIGIAASGSFYSVRDGGVHIEPLLPSHRQCVALDYAPAPIPIPHFADFLHRTFRSQTTGEEASQVRLLQEIAGAVLLGLMPQFQKAVLFYDPYGRAGKGTMERILRGLVPDRFISAVSPFKWNQEYFLAGLVGKRLNVVGELSEGEPIPASDFKSVIGGDMLAARHPHGRVVPFQNEAAHLFTSNYLITSRDQSEAFFTRWLLVEFPNSLLKLGLTPDPNLAKRIISQEMPGIAHWALDGAVRLLQQGRFSPSIAHDRLMTKWRQSSNSVDEFMHEACTLGDDKLHEKRSVLYGAYRIWCRNNGRKPHSRQHMRELMEHRVGLPVRFTKLDGYDIVRGITVNEEFRSRLDSFSF